FDDVIVSIPFCIGRRSINNQGVRKLCSYVALRFQPVTTFKAKAIPPGQSQNDENSNRNIKGQIVQINSSNTRFLILSPSERFYINYRVKGVIELEVMIELYFQLIENPNEPLFFRSPMV
ncbi:MAG TPA: hypothetical protein VFF14_06040, partial [Candidatus Deferrimicrobium sp.]|nr:hypothetical protein [Candidatus Deferrimicrobium sp.]